MGAARTAATLTVTPPSYDDDVMEVRDARRVRHEVERFARGFEAGAVAIPDVVRMWDDIDAAQCQLAAVKTLMARRVDESRAWQRAGYRSAAEFIAAKSKTSIGVARTQLDVSQKLEQQPEIAQAVRDGVLSEAQIPLVVDGTSANPAAAQRLLDQASRGSLKELRDEVLRVRAAADADPDATHRRIHQRRHFRTRRDREGAWHAGMYGTAVEGAHRSGPEAGDRRFVRKGAGGRATRIARGVRVRCTHEVGRAQRRR